MNIDTLQELKKSFKRQITTRQSRGVIFNFNLIITADNRINWMIDAAIPFLPYVVVDTFDDDIKALENWEKLKDYTVAWFQAGNFERTEIKIGKAFYGGRIEYTHLGAKPENGVYVGMVKEN